MKIFMAQPWNNLESQKGVREDEQSADPGRGEPQSSKAVQPALDLEEEVQVLILWTCSVTLGCHSLFGDSERVSLTARKKQRKTSKKHKNNSN